MTDNDIIITPTASVDDLYNDLYDRIIDSQLPTSYVVGILEEIKHDLLRGLYDDEE